MDPVSAPLSSPLKVRQRKHRVWAEDAAGQVVLDGRMQENWPERYAAATASGTHRVAAGVEGGSEHYLPVVDAGGREVARIVMRRRQDWELLLATGERATVTSRGGGMITPPTCIVGELSTAVTPRFAPQRYYTLTLADAVLAHPDRDALVVALVWISETTTASRIGDSIGSGGE
ncbi:MAG: hypothetical protein QOI15_2338 [Pseudonocardiales bacterium]|jgi:hypothetical protein|nr:hypothetical protein [Pseudonocardiales bacterium]